tara:strand:+ start:2185 stop:3057 length:873 start_codon:yes stop_codon:yes gene_type:complete
MKNIKRIIKEEINDFDWVGDIQPYQYSLSDDEWNQLNKELIPLLQDRHLRTGQAYMIALGKVKPSLYDYVTGKDMDPFSDDKKVITLIRFLNGDNDITESIKLPVEIGDTVYMGKFKNKKTVVKDIEWNEKGDLMINGKPALKMRIPKKVVKEEINDFEWAKDTEAYTSIENIGSTCEAQEKYVIKYFTEKRDHSYKDFTYSIDNGSGAVTWEFPDTDEYFVYASPYWNGECELPIDIQGDMGEYETLDIIELPQFEYEEELRDWLENEYPKIVYKSIKELGPIPEDDEY